MSGPIGACPEDEVLAQFVSGTLPLADRRAVAHHVADCPECLRVVSETRQLLVPAEEAAANPYSVATWVSIAAAALVCVGVVLWGTSERDPLRRLKAVAGRSSRRPIEASLDGFRWKRYSQTRSGSFDAGDDSLRLEAERLASASAGDAPAFHARGVGALLAGNAGAAIPDLLEATRRRPDDAVFWNDLAAARLTVCGQRHDLDAARQAIVAADHAIALDGSSPSAHFNRGLAYEYLRWKEEAIASYARSAALASSGWRDEARNRIAFLRR